MSHHDKTRSTGMGDRLPNLIPILVIRTSIGRKINRGTRSGDNEIQQLPYIPITSP